MQIFWFCCAKCRLPSKLKDLIEPVVLPKWYCVHPWGGKLSEVQLSCKIQSDYYLNGNRYSFYLTRRQFSPDCDDQSTKNLDNLLLLHFEILEGLLVIIIQQWFSSSFFILTLVYYQLLWEPYSYYTLCPTPNKCHDKKITHLGIYPGSG